MSVLGNEDEKSREKNPLQWVRLFCIFTSIKEAKGRIFLLTVNKAEDLLLKEDQLFR